MRKGIWQECCVEDMICTKAKKEASPAKGEQVPGFTLLAAEHESSPDSESWLRQLPALLDLISYKKVTVSVLSVLQGRQSLGLYTENILSTTGKGKEHQENTKYNYVTFPLIFSPVFSHFGCDFIKNK